MSSQSSRNRWVILALCAMPYFFANFHRVSSAVIASDLRAQFQASASILGVLSSTYFWTYAGLQIPVGLAADRFSPRVIITVGMAVAALGAALFGASTSLGMAIGARALAGAGVAAVYVPSLKILAESFGNSSFATATGMLVAAGNLGSLSASSPFALLVSGIGWRGSFMVIAVASVLIAVLTATLLRGEWDGIGKVRPAGAPGGGAAGAIGRRQLVVLWVLGIAMLLKYGPLMGYQGLWGVPFLVDVYGVSKVQAASTFMWVSIGYIVGCPLVGRLSDRYRVSLRTLLIATCSLYMLAWTVPAFMTGNSSMVLLKASALLMGITSGGSGVVAYSLARRHAGEGRSGMGLGIVNACSLSGGAVFQPWMGSLIDSALARGATVTAAYAATFRAVFVCMCIMVVLTLFVFEPAHEDVSEAVGRGTAMGEVN